jgi:HD-like signal output (HDOD) protein
MGRIVALTREEKLQLTVKRIFRSEGVPPFEEHAREVYVRALDPDGTSAQLTRLILKDLGLTAQMLRVANSSFYNRSGRPIISVSHAITLLGWDTVRDLVSGMRYVEEFARRSPGVRELIVQSLLTAAHAREVAIRLGHPTPEDAYVAGLFSNLGEVLVACYYPREYCEIVVAASTDKLNYRTACVRVLDFSWDELAERVAESWNLPQKVRTCVDRSGTLAKSVEQRSLASIVRYGHELTEALYRTGAAMDRVHLKTVLDAGGHDVLLTVRDLRKVVDSAVESTRHTLVALAIPVSALRFEQQAERARVLLESGECAVEAGPAAAALEQVAAEIEAGRLELSAALAALLAGVCETGMDRALFALLTEDRQWLRGRLCEGPGADEALHAFQFPMVRAEGPIAAAMLHSQDIFVDRDRDARYDASRLVRKLRPRAFAILPVVVEGLTAGCLYADRRTQGGADGARALLMKTRDLMSVVIARRKPSL